MELFPVDSAAKTRNLTDRAAEVHVVNRLDQACSGNQESPGIPRGEAEIVDPGVAEPLQQSTWDISLGRRVVLSLSLLLLIE